MIHARLAIAYPEADMRTIRLKCEAYPKECRDAKTYETWWIVSHNSNVVESVKDDETRDQEREQREPDDLKTVQALGTALRVFGTKLQGGTVCQTYGNTTTCN
jgi:hypothetical protein